MKTIESKNNKLAIILTLFKPNQKDLNYWDFLQKDLKEIGVELYVVIDNPSLEIGNYFMQSKIYRNEENIGKLRSIYSFIKKGFIKEKHFKSADPDDRIDVAELKKFLEIDFNEFAIIRTKSLRSKEECWNFTEKKLIFEKIYVEKHLSHGTGWTILPTKAIKNDIYFETNEKVNWIEDQLLALISFVNGGMDQFVEISWYVYQVNIGMTSSLNLKDFEEIVVSLNIWLKIFKESETKKIDSTFPGDLSYIKKLLASSSLEDETKKIFNDKFDKLIMQWNN